MTINQVAAAILNGPNLEDKLRFEPKASDNTEPHQTSPKVPARNRKIAFSCERPKEKFPPDALLGDPEKAAHALHHFANHELLAIELMALALLKFQAAPKVFRRGIYKTLREEQTHFKLYIERIQDFGFEFGDFHINDFFWKHISQMKSPEEYIAQMSLTFEQANLDYAKHYKDVFLRLGDTKTAAILEKVLKDEIGHVAFGVNYGKQREKNGNLWRFHTDNLTTPITPARAKGNPINTSARVLAGFDEEYIETIRHYSYSRGRASNVYLFNPDAEMELSKGRYFTPNFTQEFAHDLEDVSLFLASKDDLVLVREKHSKSFAESLFDLGLSLPETLECLTDQIELLKGKLPESRTFGAFKPWGHSPRTQKIESDLNLKNRFSKPNKKDLNLEKIHSKSFALNVYKKATENLILPQWLCSERHLGVVVKNIDSLESVLQDSTYKTHLVRSPYGVSGKNSQVIKSEGLSNSQGLWLESKFKNGDSMLVEPFLNVLETFSIQASILDEGRTKIDGISQFYSGKNQEYKGAQVRPALKLEDTRLASQIFTELKPNGILEEIVQKVGLSYFELGYCGPIGIDGFTFCENGETLYKPLTEVNCRYNFGNITLALRKLVAPGSDAIWKIDKKESARKPTTLIMKGSQIQDGILLTNDPKKARKFQSQLIVSKK